MVLMICGMPARACMVMLSAADAADPVVVTDNDEEMMLSTATDTDGGDPPTHRHCCHYPRDRFYYDHNLGDRRGGLAEEHNLPALCQDQQTDPVVLDLCQGGT